MGSQDKGVVTYLQWDVPDIENEYEEALWCAAASRRGVQEADGIVIAFRTRMAKSRKKTHESSK